MPTGGKTPCVCPSYIILANVWAPWGCLDICIKLVPVSSLVMGSILPNQVDKKERRTEESMTVEVKLRAARCGGAEQVIR